MKKVFLTIAVLVCVIVVSAQAQLYQKTEFGDEINNQLHRS